MSERLTNLLKECIYPNFTDNVEGLQLQFKKALTEEFLDRIPDIDKTEHTQKENRQAIKDSLKEIIYENSRGNRLIKNTQVATIDFQNITIAPPCLWDSHNLEFCRICYIPNATLNSDGDLECISACLKEKGNGKLYSRDMEIKIPTDIHIKPNEINKLWDVFAAVVTDCYNMFHNNTKDLIYRELKRDDLLAQIITTKLAEKGLDILKCQVKKRSAEEVEVQIARGNENPFLEIQKPIEECEENPDQIVEEAAILYDFIKNKKWKITSYWL